MRILAFDQASHTTGYSIYEDGELVKYGKFTFDDDDFGVRLNKIRNQVKDMVCSSMFDKVYFEDIQLQEDVGNNVATFKKLAEVFGVIYELLTALGIPNEAILATVWKSGVGITGKQRTEQKKNAQKWVKEKYGFSVTEDEADAICIGAYASGYRAPKIEKVKKSKVEGFDWS